MHVSWYVRSIVLGAVAAILLSLNAAPARYTEAAPSSAPVTSHPRLWVRAEDLPRLRSWAVPSNPLYGDLKSGGLASLAQQAKGDMDGGLVPNMDSGFDGYETYPTEAYASFFAFMSLISNDPAARNDYAQRARTLLMYMMNIIDQGPAKGLPFRDPDFATSDSNRSRWYGEGFALTVDWIYSSLSATDKATIRRVFLRWSDDISTRSYGQSGIFVPTPAVFNHPSLVQTTDRRWALNNYFTAHMRNLGLMALVMDEADDPGNTLRNYLRSATGGWLYMVDHNLRNDSRGGLLPEGFEYSPQTGAYILQFLLALKTAGQDDPTAWGPQVVLNGNPFWDDAVAAYLHSISPVPVVQKDYIGPVYLPAYYGDGAVYNTLDHIAMFAPLGLYDSAMGNTTRLSAARWIQTNTAPGGASRLTGRAGERNDLLGSLLYFMLFDPAAPPAPDPRPSFPKEHFASGLGRILARTSWGVDATWFSYLLKWNQIDHQLADGNQFEFYRRGEWLTKERTGYDGAQASAPCNIGSTEYHNSLGLENSPPKRDGPGHVRNCWLRGSQWHYVAAGDPQVLARSFDPNFVYATGDATNLYNSVYENSTDILHASRSIMWLKPDHVVVYDRAVSKTSNRFKRFWLNLPTQPSIAGNRAMMTTASGQQLAVTSLLPAGAAISSDAGDPEATPDTAQYEPMAFRLRIEAPGGPASARFLTVLQGADPGAQADAVTLVQSSGGTPFSGALVKNTAVFFPVDLGVLFASLTYAVPSTTTTHLISGLVPGASYTVVSQVVGGNTQIVISPGAGSQADSGGVLRIGGAPPTTPSPTGSATVVVSTPTRTSTPTPSVTASAGTATIGTVTPSRTPTPSATSGTPTPTATPPTVSGHGFTLQSAASAPLGPVVADRVLTWVPGTQTNSLILRWSPENGFAFLPPLLPGAGLYRDSEALADPTYCYILLAYRGDLSSPDVRGLSDLLCVSPGTAAGTPPAQFAVRLGETDTARLSWTGPVGVTRYDLNVVRFDNSPNEVIPLIGTPTTFDHFTGGQTACYQLMAFNGASLLGRTDVLCAAPRVFSFLGGAAPGGAAGIAPLDRLRAWIEVDSGVGR